MEINGNVPIAFWISDFAYDLFMVKGVSEKIGDDLFWYYWSII